MISLIIPTCNRPDDLKRCLDAIRPQLPDDGSVEVIVGDDGKHAAGRAVTAESLPSAHWIKGPSRGPAANRNMGARHASGEWLIFLDDDCVPSSQYLAAYIQAMRSASEDVAVLEGCTTRLPKPPSLLWEAPETTTAHDYLTCSANFAIRAKVFAAVGGFDERYEGGVYAEDVDLSARLSRAGHQVQFAPAAAVVHPIRRVPDAEKLARRWEGKVIFAFDQGASAFTVGWRLPWHTLRVIQSRFRGQPWNVENACAAWLFFREWLLVVSKTRGWVNKWAPAPRSSFWSVHAGAVPKHGF
jgi:GT2 family glycosyltransferase